MSCCGNQRARLAPPIPATDPLGGAVDRRYARPEDAGRRFHAVFEYRGATALTVIGPRTGARYHFASPGARLAIDLADRAGLAQVPTLREVA